MARDFFDDDLLKNAAEEPSDEPTHEGVPVRPITETGLTRMARQKEELAGQVADAVQEIDQLRRRQDELEREKNDLEELNRKQDEYEKGKHEIMTNLDRAIRLAEKEEIRSTRLAELLAETRRRFKETLAELRQVDETAWPDEAFREELERALGMVEDARVEYKRALSKIDAVNWEKDSGAEEQIRVFREAGAANPALDRRFLPWFKIGVAVTLPLIAVLLILFVLWLFFTGMWPLV